ncbi:hypothetical protein GQ55_1G145900 [Panicum hallii var. hallii]|uniref:Uncharacterized protein n=1 Tax=Panicum hallii var. hallii TaxID=1504633 RepID=A0A2T7F5A6_9POAL|nr:hypothetical protein GQ55_1G145900 [Panicum hallii var. hallii]
MICDLLSRTSRWLNNICISMAQRKEVFRLTSSCEAPAGCAARKAQRKRASMLT